MLLLLALGFKAPLQFAGYYSPSGKRGKTLGKEIQKAESVRSFRAKEQEILKERTLTCVYEHPSSSSEHTLSSPCQRQKGWGTKAATVKAATSYHWNNSQLTGNKSTG